MSRLTRMCSLALTGAAIAAAHPATSDAHTLTFSRAETAAAPRVGELMVNLSWWPFEDPQEKFKPTWGRHTRHNKHLVELRVILTEKVRVCGPAGDGDEGGFVCKVEPREQCFRIGALYRPTERPRILVGDPKRIDCALAHRKRHPGATTRPQTR